LKMEMRWRRRRCKYPLLNVIHNTSTPIFDSRF
jgi:hypothetical protein